MSPPAPPSIPPPALAADRSVTNVSLEIAAACACVWVRVQNLMAVAVKLQAVFVFVCVEDEGLLWWVMLVPSLRSCRSCVRLANDVKLDSPLAAAHISNRVFSAPAPYKWLTALKLETYHIQSQLQEGLICTPPVFDWVCRCKIGRKKKVNRRHVLLPYVLYRISARYVQMLNESDP